MGERAEVVPGDRPGTFVVRMDGMDQSLVDLDDPTHLAFDYVRRLADVVDVHAPHGLPLRIAHVGGGGLTLPRYVAATRPRSSQVVFEPDAQLVATIRQRLPLPPRSGIRVRPVDGREGLATLRPSSAQLVVLDAFAGGRVPAGLVTREFFADVRRVLAAEGRLAANLVDRAPFPHARRAVAAIRAEFADILVVAEPATLRGRRQGNLVVVAGATVPTAELSARSAGSAAPYRVLEAAVVSDTLGGGRPFTDADAAAGPMPSRA